MLNWRERLSNLGWLYLSVYWVYLVVFIQINNIFIFFNRLHGNTYPKQILVGILAPYFILEISLAVTMWRAELKMALHQSRICSFRYLMHTLLQHLCTGLGWQKSTPAQQTWAHFLQMETVGKQEKLIYLNYVIGSFVDCFCLKLPDAKEAIDRQREQQQEPRVDHDNSVSTWSAASIASALYIITFTVADMNFDYFHCIFKNYFSWWSQNSITSTHSSLTYNTTKCNSTIFSVGTVISKLK